jgi:hypothetical protein
LQTAQLAADLRNKLRAKAEAQGVDPAMVDKLSDEDVIAIENMVDTTSIRAAYQDDVELQNFPNISRGPTGELIGPPEQLNRYIAHRRAQFAAKARAFMVQDDGGEPVSAHEVGCILREMEFNEEQRKEKLEEQNEQQG